MMLLAHSIYYFFFFNDTATTEIYTLSLHDALPISHRPAGPPVHATPGGDRARDRGRGLHRSRGRLERSEEHTSELQSLAYLVCRLLLEKKKKTKIHSNRTLNVYMQAVWQWHGDRVC